MRFNLSAAVAIAAASMLLTVTAYAQDPDPEPPPCTPNDGYNCSAMNWTGPFQFPMQVGVCGQPCNINVVYYKRSGSCPGLPIIHEFQIVQIELNDPTCPNNCPPKPTLADDYLAQATFFMLHFNPMQFPTSPQIGGGCVTDWRASMSACQFIYQSRFGRRYVIKCANAPECCTGTYRVCTNEFGQIISVKSTSTPVPPNACPPEVIIGSQTPCRPSCNSLTDLIDPYYGKMVHPNDDNGATVTPNPANGHTVITSPAMVDGGALLMLYDVRGTAVDHQRAEHTSAGRYTYTLNVSKLPAGVYYYSIKADNDKPISFGHLTVTK
jgi:hypothetical protein